MDHTLTSLWLNFTTTAEFWQLSTVRTVPAALWRGFNANAEEVKPLNVAVFIVTGHHITFILPSLIVTEEFFSCIHLVVVMARLPG